MAATELQDGDTDLVPDQTNDLAGSSDDLLKQWLALAVTSQRTATGTVVRKFVNTIDKAVPLDGVGLDKRREVISAALEMTQRLVHAPYDFGRGLVQSAVLVNVNVDVDIASREPTTRSTREEG
jgi:hypothetical protein